MYAYSAVQNRYITPDTFLSFLFATDQTTTPVEFQNSEISILYSTMKASRSLMTLSHMLTVRICSSSPL